MADNRYTQEKVMTQDELRLLIGKNMPEGMMAVINFNDFDSDEGRNEEDGKTGRN